TITSEGALLSATAQSRGATGGLLKKIGSRGLLVIKDMTSLLEMDVRARGLVLAALREVYDGKWERNVGVGGGRTPPGPAESLSSARARPPGMLPIVSSPLWGNASSSYAPIQRLGASAQRCEPSAIPARKLPCGPSWRPPLRTSLLA